MFAIHNTKNFSQNARLPQTLLLKLVACWLTQQSSFIRAHKPHGAHTRVCTLCLPPSFHSASCES